MPEKVQADYFANTAAAVRNVEKFTKATQKTGKASRFAATALTEWGAQLKSTFFGFVGANLVMGVAAKVWDKITESSRRAADAIKDAKDAQQGFTDEARKKFGPKGKTSSDIEAEKTANILALAQNVRAQAAARQAITGADPVGALTKFTKGGEFEKAGGGAPSRDISQQLALRKLRLENVGADPGFIERMSRALEGEDVGATVAATQAREDTKLVAAGLRTLARLQEENNALVRQQQSLESGGGGGGASGTSGALDALDRREQAASRIE